MGKICSFILYSLCLAVGVLAQTASRTPHVNPNNTPDPCPDGGRLLDSGECYYSFWDNWGGWAVLIFFAALGGVAVWTWRRRKNKKPGVVVK